VATNALIQNKGARTGLITTDGFRDLLEIGRQKRPSCPGGWRADFFGALGAGGRPGSGDGVSRRVCAAEPWGRDAAEGETIEVVTAGSGGYGLPAARDSKAVARDLAEGRINQTAARQIYRV
jgi:hypothetical protein